MSLYRVKIEWAPLFGCWHGNSIQDSFPPGLDDSCENNLNVESYFGRFHLYRLFGRSWWILSESVKAVGSIGWSAQKDHPSQSCLCSDPPKEPICYTTRTDNVKSYWTITPCLLPGTRSAILGSFLAFPGTWCLLPGPCVLPGTGSGDPRNSSGNPRNAPSDPRTVRAPRNWLGRSQEWSLVILGTG